MELKIREANPGEIPVIANLAKVIWNEYYPPIIGQKQVDYMLQLMYSENSLRDDFNENVRFFLAFIDDEPVGFTAFNRLKKGIVFLHKLYVLSEVRGSSVSRDLLERIEKEVSENSREIHLQVNRFNIRAINFYFRQGFKISKVMDKPIGEGYVMEDYLMTKAITKAF